MIRSILILSRGAAEARYGRATTAMIAIADPGVQIALQPGFEDVLRMHFDTTESELETAALRVPGARPATPFSAAHAGVLSAFLDYLLDRRDTVQVIICENQGYTRSTAVALWAKAKYGVPVEGAVSEADKMMLEYLHRLWTDSCSSCRAGVKDKSFVPRRSTISDCRLIPVQRRNLFSDVGGGSRTTVIEATP